MIRIETMNSYHLRNIKEKAEPCVYDKIVQNWQSNGLKYVGMVDYEIVGAGGLKKNSDYWIAWLWLTPEIQKRPFLLVRTIKSYLTIMIEMNGIKRVVCTIQLYEKPGSKWIARKERFAELMGFVPFGQFLYYDERPGEIFMERLSVGSRQ